jgi:hypothetical protein
MQAGRDRVCTGEDANGEAGGVMQCESLQGARYGRGRGCFPFP